MDELQNAASEYARKMASLGAQLAEAGNALTRAVEKSVEWHQGLVRSKLPAASDSVVMVTDDRKRKWLGWRAHDGSWDVLDGRGSHEQMSDAELTHLGTWVELKAEKVQS